MCTVDQCHRETNEVGLPSNVSRENKVWRIKFGETGRRLNRSKATSGNRVVDTVEWPQGSTGLGC